MNEHFFDCQEWNKLGRDDGCTDSLRDRISLLEGALDEALRLLSICSFDAPEDIAELDMIYSVISATEQQKESDEQ